MDREKVYILNPDYHFKNDTDRIVMYSNHNVAYDSEIDWLGYIHPYQAMLLGLFTNDSTFEEHCREISDYFKITLNEAEDMMGQYVENKGAVYTKQGDVYVRFPKNVLIKLEGELPDYDFSQDELMCHNVDVTPDRMHRAPNTALFMLNNHCVTDCMYCYAD